ncbi:MAG: hypothetical protein AB1467_06680 [Candidatus Diapherotrites archaeon]
MTQEEYYCVKCGKEIGSGQELKHEFHKLFPDCDLEHANLHTVHRILDALKEKNKKA